MVSDIRNGKKYIQRNILDYKNNKKNNWSSNDKYQSNKIMNRKIQDNLRWNNSKGNTKLDRTTNYMKPNMNRNKFPWSNNVHQVTYYKWDGVNKLKKRFSWTRRRVVVPPSVYRVTKLVRYKRFFKFFFYNGSRFLRKLKYNFISTYESKFRNCLISQKVNNVLFRSNFELIRKSYTDLNLEFKNQFESLKSDNSFFKRKNYSTLFLRNSIYLRKLNLDLLKPTYKFMTFSNSRGNITKKFIYSSRIKKSSIYLNFFKNKRNKFYRKLYSFRNTLEYPFLFSYNNKLTNIIKEKNKLSYFNNFKNWSSKINNQMFNSVSYRNKGIFNFLDLVGNKSKNIISYLYLRRNYKKVIISQKKLYTSYLRWYRKFGGSYFKVMNVPYISTLRYKLQRNNAVALDLSFFKNISSKFNLDKFKVVFSRNSILFFYKHINLKGLSKIIVSFNSLGFISQIDDKQVDDLSRYIQKYSMSDISSGWFSFCYNWDASYLPSFNKSLLKFLKALFIQPCFRPRKNFWVDRSRAYIPIEMDNVSFSYLRRGLNRFSWVSPLKYSYRNKLNFKHLRVIRLFSFWSLIFIDVFLFNMYLLIFSLWARFFVLFSYNSYLSLSYNFILYLNKDMIYDKSLYFLNLDWYRLLNKKLSNEKGIIFNNRLDSIFNKYADIEVESNVYHTRNSLKLGYAFILDFCDQWFLLLGDDSSNDKEN